MRREFVPCGYSLRCSATRWMLTSDGNELLTNPTPPSLKSYAVPKWNCIPYIYRDDEHTVKTVRFRRILGCFALADRSPHIHPSHRLGLAVECLWCGSDVPVSRRLLSRPPLSRHFLRSLANAGRSLRTVLVGAVGVGQWKLVRDECCARGSASAVFRPWGLR